MKLKKILCCFMFLQFLLFAAHSFARDTDLYIDSESTIEPNILIIFDNSGSMSSSPGWTSFCEYDPGYSYPQPTDPSIPSISSAKVYRKKSGKWIPLTTFKSSVSGVGCSQARNGLNWNGLYTGFTNAAGSPKKTDLECTKQSYSLATGNYLRWMYADEENTDPCRSKMDIAKDVVKDFVNTITGVRLGLMIFNNNNEGGYIKNEVKGLDEKYDGSAGSQKTHREHLIKDITNLSPDTWTPLAETLYEGGLYFSGAASYFNSGTTYTSPIQYYCQKNYVIFMTDGMSTQDQNDILNTQVGDRNSDQKEPPWSPGAPDYGSGSDYLDDVAKKHYDEDFHSLQGKQNINTYTIGFELDMSGGDDAVWAKDLLQRAANHGHGKFYTTSGAGGLADAFSNVLDEVLAKTSSFVAPIVPVSKMERTTAGDKIYLAFFRPNQSGMWSGNIKKYGVAQSNDPSKDIAVGDILDASGSKALDANGAFYPSSKSFWTTASSDGGEVEAGGVGEILQNRTADRKIYTLLPGDDQDEDDGPDSNTSFDLTNSWNAFTVANSRLTSSKLDVSSGDRDPLINFVRGIDAYDDNLNGETTDMRDWVLGSFLHSRPYIIHYADRTVIYAGSNDGMLHAFDDATGEELWGFVPPCFLAMLKYLHTETPPIYVDGSPKAYVTYDGSGNVTKAILIFGLRRGVDKDGKGYYYALDVTNPTVPKYLYRIYDGKKGYFNQIGQTWSTPVIGKVAYGTGEKWVAIFGGGYDDEMDLANPDVGDIKEGRGMYLADVLTGAYVWGRSRVGSEDPLEQTMTYPIPSDFATLDLNGDGRIDRLYVGDTNGRMWRFDISSSSTSNWTMKKIFQSNPGGSEKRRIFYPPDVTLEKDGTGEYEMLFFGTGDREDPKGTKDVDRIYAFKDKNASTTKGEADLVNVTGFYELSEGEQAAKLGDIEAGYGWYIILDKKSGEKCLASPVVYYKTAYFTSFSPSTEAILDPCFVGEGTAALYAVNYSTGEAVFNLDLTNDIGGNVVKGKSDRSTIIGSAIPSGVVVTVIGGKVTAYIGVGGGVYRPTLSTTRSMFPVHWKLVF